MASEDCAECNCCEDASCPGPHMKCNSSHCDGDGSTLAERRGERAPASAQCPPHIPRDGKCRWCGEDVPASAQGTGGDSKPAQTAAMHDYIDGPGGCWFVVSVSTSGMKAHCNQPPLSPLHNRPPADVGARLDALCDIVDQKCAALARRVDVLEKRADKAHSAILSHAAIIAATPAQSPAPLPTAPEAAQELAPRTFDQPVQRVGPLPTTGLASAVSSGEEHSRATCDGSCVLPDDEPAAPNPEVTTVVSDTGARVNVTRYQPAPVERHGKDES